MNIPRPEFPGPQLVRDTWMNPTDNGWGYGTAPKTEEEFAERYSGLTSMLLGIRAYAASAILSLPTSSRSRTDFMHMTAVGNFPMRCMK